MYIISIQFKKCIIVKLYLYSNSLEIRNNYTSSITLIFNYFLSYALLMHNL